MDPTTCLSYQPNLINHAILIKKFFQFHTSRYVPNSFWSIYKGEIFQMSALSGYSNKTMEESKNKHVPKIKHMIIQLPELCPARTFPLLVHAYTIMAQSKNSTVKWKQIIIFSARVQSEENHYKQRGVYKNLGLLCSLKILTNATIHCTMVACEPFTKVLLKHNQKTNKMEKLWTLLICSTIHHISPYSKRQTDKDI